MKFRKNIFRLASRINISLYIFRLLEKLDTLLSKLSFLSHLIYARRIVRASLVRNRTE